MIVHTKNLSNLCGIELILYEYQKRGETIDKIKILEENRGLIVIKREKRVKIQVVEIPKMAQFF